MWFIDRVVWIYQDMEKANPVSHRVVNNKGSQGWRQVPVGPVGYAQDFKLLLQDIRGNWRCPHPGR